MYVYFVFIYIYHVHKEDCVYQFSSFGVLDGSILLLESPYIDVGE